jgi:hypothetical protein
MSVLKAKTRTKTRWTREFKSDFDSYPLKMGLKAALCRWQPWFWLFS